VLDASAAKVGEMVDATYRTVPATGTPRILARVRTPSTFTIGSDMRSMGGPFDARVIGDVGPSGDVAHSNGTRYEVEMFPASGAPWRLEIDAPLRTVTSAERDSALAAITRRFRVTIANELPPAVREAYQAHRANHPPLSLMKVLRDGTVWVRRRRPRARRRRAGISSHATVNALASPISQCRRASGMAVATGSWSTSSATTTSHASCGTAWGGDRSYEGARIAKAPQRRVSSGRSAYSKSGIVLEKSTSVPENFPMIGGKVRCPQRSSCFRRSGDM
jgi:hypothetical protein